MILFCDLFSASFVSSHMPFVTRAIDTECTKSEKKLQDKELKNVSNQKHTPNKKVDVSTIAEEWK